MFSPCGAVGVGVGVGDASVSVTRPFDLGGSPLAAPAPNRRLMRIAVASPTPRPQPLVFTLYRDDEIQPVRMDESGNGKFPYRPTPNTEIPDRISFSREKTDSGRNPGKYGESGVEIG